MFGRAIATTTCHTQRSITATALLLPLLLLTCHGALLVADARDREAATWIDSRSSKAEVLAAVRRNGDQLNDASQALKGDAEVVMVAVAQTGLALMYGNG